MSASLLQLSSALRSLGKQDPKLTAVPAPALPAARWC